jgi:tRNA(fMet)-specific endonuclease VapC
MNGKYLLDTNIVIAIFAGDTDVLKRLAQSDEVFLPAIVLGELYYGARKSTHIDANIGRIDEPAASSALLGCDIDTSRHYGRIKTDLRAKGRPIPENDIWIAAVAHQHGLTLVSRDAHFDEVDALSLEVW